MKKPIKYSLAENITAVSALPKDQVFGLLERPKNTEFGDIAFPCFLLAKSWKASPADAAKRLAAEMALPESVERATAVGPFLNFRFRRDSYVARVIEEIAAIEKLTAGVFPRADSERIVLEYSSPNIAKPFHVGHLRTTLIGNSLDRVYRRLGFPTVSVNHLGDWGTQFGFVWAGCEIWGKPSEASVIALVELYRRATALKEEQENNSVPVEFKNAPDVNAMARNFFVDLERGENYALEFWKWCLDISLEYLRGTYDRLGVSFDHYTGESFYSDKLEDVKNDINRSGLLVESQGALGVDLGEKLGFARIFTPDGRSLYLTRDLATADYRAKTFQFTKAIYVVGTPQTLHFQQIKAVLAALGKDYAERILHVPFGHVIGMKTRGGGEVVELNEFLDEAYERALEAYREQVAKRPEGLDEHEVAEAVAIGAIVFSNLSRDKLKDVHFSWEHALTFQGDSGPYLLYAYARINGIREKAAAAGLAPQGRADAKHFTEESAFALAAAIDEYPEALERTVSENEPAHLASFALDVAKMFSRAYNELHVVGEEKDLAEARLTLFESARVVLREAISLLGMKVLERM